MRVSSRENPNAHVLLNGVQLNYVLAADDGEGWVERCVTDRNGWIVMADGKKAPFLHDPAVIEYNRAIIQVERIEGLTGLKIVMVPGANL